MMLPGQLLRCMNSIAWLLPLTLTISQILQCNCDSFCILREWSIEKSFWGKLMDGLQLEAASTFPTSSKSLSLLLSIVLLSLSLALSWLFLVGIGMASYKVPLVAANDIVKVDIWSFGYLYFPFVSQIDSEVIPGCWQLHEPTLINILSLPPQLNDVSSLLNLYCASIASHAITIGEKTPLLRFIRPAAFSMAISNSLGMPSSNDSDG